MVSIAIFGGGACAKSHIQSFSKLPCAKLLSIKVYTNNSNFLLIDCEKYFYSFSIDTPDNYKQDDAYDIVLIANKSSDHLNTWKLANKNFHNSLIIIEKPFAASLAPSRTSISFLFSNSFVLFQKRMLFFDLAHKKNFGLAIDNANNNSIHLKTRLVKHSSSLQKLEVEYKGLSLKNIILLHFCIHEIDLIEFCSNSKITEINSDFSIVQLDRSMISVEGVIEGYLLSGLSFSISYKQAYAKLPQINKFHFSKDNKSNQAKDMNYQYEYSNMSEIRDCFWEKVINGDREPLRRLTSCISLENSIIKASS